MAGCEYTAFRPFRQRCEAFSSGSILLKLFEFSALFGGYFCHVGIAEGFLVGVLWTVASSFVGAVVVTLHDSSRQSLQQIIFGFGKLMQLTHTLSQRTHRLCHDFFRDPFDVAMKFTFVKQFTGWNEPIDQFPKQLVIFARPLFLALLLVCTFGGALLLPATHGQIPF